MNAFPDRIRHGTIRLVLFSSILILAVGPMIFSQTNDHRDASRSTPSAAPNGLIETPSATSKPLSRASKLSVAAAAMIVVLIVLLFSIRAWRAGNLFDREYRFSPVASVAIRLGGNRSGGCMAILNFRDPPNAITATDSRREDS
jgi:hypothetical protein